MDTYLIGLDIAKNVFTAHAIDRTGKPLFRKKLSRSELLPFFASISVSTIAMEACGGAHHWARKFQELGHQTQLLPAQHVKPFLRGQKNDMRDAQAIVEAALMPAMHRVPTKSVEQQTILSLHRLRTGWMEERTALSNRIRSLRLSQSDFLSLRIGTDDLSRRSIRHYAIGNIFKHKRARTDKNIVPDVD